MLAIQADAHGRPTVMESVGEPGAKTFREVTAERWRDIVGQELDLSEVDRPILPIQSPELSTFDDGDPVSDDWLSSIGLSEDSIGIIDVPNFGPQVTWIGECDLSGFQVRGRTRGDIRRLCKVLGYRMQPLKYA